MSETRKGFRPVVVLEKGRHLCEAGGATFDAVVALFAAFDYGG